MLLLAGVRYSVKQLYTFGCRAPLTVGSGSIVIAHPDNISGSLNRQTVEWIGEEDVTGCLW